MAGLLNRPRGGRRLAAVVVAGLVVAGHLWLSSRVSEALVSAGAGDKPVMQRMDVAFVRELQQAAPPAAAPARAAPTAQPKPPAQAALAAEPAASAASAVPPEAEPPQPEPVPGLVAQAPEAPPLPEPPEPAAPAEPPQPASEAAPAESAFAASQPPAASQPMQVASASAPAFEWPPSTRLDYVLTGNYRGEVNGHARVQWIRQARRYQVHVDVVVGPSFAPLVARRMTSDGAITAGGLVPQAYEEVTSTLLGQSRRRSLRFEPDRIVLDRGTAEPWPGVQDTASQFVQLTWLFTTQPQLLRVGQALEFPLALPRRIDRWHYDVVAEETLYTRMGALNAFHVKPRRESMRQGELSAELWFAPTLQYLPVRILIRHEGDTHVDLMLDAPPLQTQ